MSRNKTIIPDKLYIGLRNEGNQLPNATIAPASNGSNDKKRIATVQSRQLSHTIPDAVIDNTPAGGFWITSTIISGQYGGGDNWTIEDPRGFESSIRSHNIGTLFRTCVIENGEILNQCVWGRKGGENVLLSVDGDEYKEAIDNTKLRQTSVSIKNIKPGYQVTLQNGVTGKYLGKVTPLYRKGYSSVPFNQQFVTESQRHAIMSDMCDNHYLQSKKSTLHWISAPKFSSFISGTVLSNDEIETIINDCIHDKHCYQKYQSYRSPIAAAIGDNLVISFSLNALGYDFPSFGYNSDIIDKLVLIKTKSGEVGEVSRSNSTQTTERIYLINPSSLDDVTLIPIINTSMTSRTYDKFGSNRISKDVNITTDIEQYYTVNCHIKTKHGSTITVII